MGLGLKEIKQNQSIYVQYVMKTYLVVYILMLILQSN